MKTLRKLLALSLMLCLIFALASCGVQTLSGPYAAVNSDGDTVFYTFGETEMTKLVQKETYLGQYVYEESTAAYEIKNPLFGETTISIYYDNGDLIEKASLEIILSEDKETIEAITIMDLMPLNKDVLPDRTPKPVTYSAGGSLGGLAGANLSYTFCEDTVTVTSTTTVLGQSVVIEYTGSYKINELADGSTTITMIFKELDATGYNITNQAFIEDQEADTITIGMLTYTKQP